MMLKLFIKKLIISNIKTAISKLKELRKRESLYHYFQNNCATHCAEIFNDIGFYINWPTNAIPSDYHVEMESKFKFTK